MLAGACARGGGGGRVRGVHGDPSRARLSAQRRSQCLAARAHGGAAGRAQGTGSEREIAGFRGAGTRLPAQATTLPWPITRQCHDRTHLRLPLPCAARSSLSAVQSALLAPLQPEFFALMKRYRLCVPPAARVRSAAYDPITNRVISSKTWLKS